MIEYTESFKIHDFRFEVNLEICTTTFDYRIMKINVFFVGIDDHGVQLSPGGSTYVLDTYLDDVIDFIETNVGNWL